ncbi:unnamed protein product [Chondrus crispus]|uniref:Uncharacterized protein n=1 Tax=Chondrus crispus TaxID=2769 RepID=R7Q8Y8_CHOCR|nr:unnamed protein product [Chondrus crispus]CDF33940.1 unnamed protein product [Chondrus crispus]|eukprot:XP_005713759.1 unnamed protein product [Chondrus crispus]
MALFTVPASRRICRGFQHGARELYPKGTLRRVPCAYCTVATVRTVGGQVYRPRRCTTFHRVPVSMNLLNVVSSPEYRLSPSVDFRPAFLLLAADRAQAPYLQP